MLRRKLSGGPKSGVLAMNIGDKTWEKIKERKEAKLKMESARSERLKQRRRQEYNAKNNEVSETKCEGGRAELDGGEGCSSRKGR